MKKSLFVKILLWFLIASALVTFAYVATTVVLFSTVHAGQWPLPAFLNFALDHAREAYETGGREGLGREVARIERFFRVRAYLTDASGVDLLTSIDRRAWIEQADKYPRQQLLRHNRLVFARQSPDRRYWLLLVFPRPRLIGMFGHLAYLWVAALAAVLCYVLARHLSSPLRALQASVERFGHGDLSARAKAESDDEFGDLARAFNRMAGRIETSVETERRLLQDISHELRSPLARLGVAIELARDGDSAHLDRVQREADRLNQLVGQLLQLTRAEPHFEPLQLDQLAAEVVEDGRLEAQPKQCSIELTAAEVKVEGDAELLRRALENVLRNAIRYAPEGSAIAVTLTPDGTITVRDHGPGVPEASLPHLFDAFYRVAPDRDRATGGVGLGLAIARRAVEAHGGRISAANASPGLEVTMTIPRAVSRRN